MARAAALAAFTAALLSGANVAWGQTDPQPPPYPVDTDVPGPAPPPSTADSEGNQTVHQVLTDMKDYFTAPLRWKAEDWAWVGGAVALTGIAHNYDSQVRTHFVGDTNPQTINAHDAGDAAPTIAVLLATWGYAGFTHSVDGKQEAWSMQEAAGLSTIAVYALKYAFRREGPGDTNNENQWFKSGGNSFPSAHTAAAFAVGTVLAESGNDDYRWVRRVLGYGLGVGTGFLRLKHNAHWLSDTVASAALGGATAHFSMLRNEREDGDTGLGIAPMDKGVMLTYRVTFP